MTSHRPLAGIAFMVMSCALLASKDGLAKTFLDQVGPAQIIWIQYVGTFIATALIAAPKYGWRVLQPAPLGGQFFRGAVSAGAVASLYWALTYIPLAEATAMFMLSPVVVALLSPMLLGERIDNARRVAIAVGFAGVLVMLKPGFGGSGVGYLIGVMAGFLMAAYFIANRRLAASSPPLINVAHNALMGAIALTPFLPLFWQTPPMALVPKLGGIVALAVIGQGLMISSFSFAPANVVAPYTYAMLVFAALIGWAVFGNLPDAAGWTGITLIVGAGLFIAQRERRGAAVGRP